MQWGSEVKWIPLGSEVKKYHGVGVLRCVGSGEGRSTAGGWGEGGLGVATISIYFVE